jgi:hypothetical protein
MGKSLSTGPTGFFDLGPALRLLSAIETSRAHS